MDVTTLSVKASLLHSEGYFRSITVKQQQRYGVISLTIQNNTVASRDVLGSLFPHIL